MRLLPVPGPPVSTLTPSSIAAWTARRWVASSSSSAAATSTTVRSAASSSAASSPTSTSTSDLGCARRGERLRAVDQQPDALGDGLLGGGVALQGQRGAGVDRARDDATLGAGPCHGRTRVGHPGLDQRVADLGDRQRGVPVAGGPAQRLDHHRPAAAYVVDPDSGQHRAGEPVGLREAHLGEVEQQPRVGAQPIDGDLAELSTARAASRAGRPAVSNRPDHVVRRAGADPGRQQPVGPLGADLGKGLQAGSGHGVGPGDAGRDEGVEWHPAETRPQPGLAERRENRVSGSPAGPTAGGPGLGGGRRARFGHDTSAYGPHPTIRRGPQGASADIADGCAQAANPA